MDHLSLVAPVYNERENLPLLHEAVRSALTGRDMRWEVIYVDDGSTDGSACVLEDIASSDPEHVVVIEFRRNYGQTAAMAAGIEQASGDVIVLMDADLQNDPADIPMLLEKLDGGYDVACGWRKDRHDAFFSRKIPSKAANWLIGRITGVRLHDYGCTLKAFRREILQSFKLYGEMHRFIPPYACWAGGRIVEVPVRHHARRFGRSKYGISRTAKVILDLLTVRLLTTFSVKPMYLFGRTGLYLMGLSPFPLIYLGVSNMLLGRHEGVFPPLTLSALLFLMGLQSVFFGLLAEVSVRTYHESQGRPAYTIRRIVGGKEGVNAEVPEDLDRLGPASGR